MKIAFEDWIQTQKFNETINRLFDESLLCYRVGAYSASLLFSFAAFQKILKYRLINFNSHPPKTFESDVSEWHKIISDLHNEDKVDNKVTQCIYQNKGSIFVLNDDLRNQYMYWKDRRNDCAHGKSNFIDVNHVESFWLFLKSNLPKFQVNGGKEALLNNITIYLDDNITPLDASPLVIVEDIPKVVNTPDCQTFFSDILKMIKKSDFYTLFEDIEDKPKKLLLEICNLSNDYQSILINLLEKEPAILITLLKENSNLLEYISDSGVIRKLWRKHLHESSTDNLKIIIALLKLEKIPENELGELFSRISYFNLRYFNANYFNVATKEDYMILKNNGYIEYFEKEAFSENKIDIFSFANNNKYLITLYVKYEKEIPEQYLRLISNVFSNLNYPHKLKETLQKAFKEDPELYNEFEMRYSNIKLEVPEYLKIKD